MTAYTEAEAKTKWCPFVRLMVNSGGVLGDSPPHNRVLLFNVAKDDNIPEAAYCIASACMAWRTGDGVHGYCGLAGKP